MKLKAFDHLNMCACIRLTCCWCRHICSSIGILPIPFSSFPLNNLQYWRKIPNCSNPTFLNHYIALLDSTNLDSSFDETFLFFISIYFILYLQSRYGSSYLPLNIHSSSREILCKTNHHFWVKRKFFVYIYIFFIKTWFTPIRY